MRRFITVLASVALMIFLGYLALQKVHLPTSSTPASPSIRKSHGEILPHSGESSPRLPADGPAAGAREAVAVQGTVAATTETAETVSSSGAICGIVVSSHGTPVAGARVAASVSGGSGGSVATAVTGGDGRFAFSELTAPRYDLGALAPSGGAAWASSIAVGSTDIVLTLESTGQISGQVYDEMTGQGVAGVEIMAAPAEDMASRNYALVVDELQETVSDSNGRFSVAVVTPGIYHLTVRSGSGYIYPARQPRVALRKGERRTGIRIGLVRAASVAGRVYDPSGQPASLAQAELISLGQGSMTAQATAYCDATGAFLFDSVQPGRNYVIRASHPRFAAGVGDAFTVVSGQQLTGLRVQLSGGHSVSGQVVCSDGQSVAGVKVSLVPEENRISVPYLNATTDNDGRFVIANVGPGSYTPSVVTCSGSGFHRTIVRADPFTMPPDRDVSGLVIDIGMEREGFISGTVTDTDGNPLHGITVLAHSGNATGVSDTSDDGAYRVDGLGSAPHWMIEVFDTQTYSGQMREQVPVNSENVNFTLSRKTQLSGFVFDSVTNHPITEFEVRTETGAWTRYFCLDGTFSISAASAGEVILEARAHGYQLATVGPIPAGTAEVVQVPLTPGGTLSGIVIASTTGEPVAGARVRAFSPDDNLSHLAAGFGWSELDATTDENGRFLLKGTSTAVPVALLAWKPGFALSFEVGHAEHELIFVLDAGGFVQGAAAIGGEPAANLSIDLVRDTTSGGLAYTAHIVTGATGNFRSPLLPIGTYEIFCYDAAGLDAQLLWQNQIQVFEGSTTEVDIQIASKHR